MLVVLLALHALSIHGLAETLVYCYEEDGQVVLESEFASFLTIPSEQQLHGEAPNHHKEPNVTRGYESHHDIAVTSICQKEQRITRFDQDKFFKLLDGILNASIQELPRSRSFQVISFIPPTIENVITTSIQTVVLLN